MYMYIQKSILTKIFICKKNFFLYVAIFINTTNIKILQMSSVQYTIYIINLMF